MRKDRAQLKTAQSISRAQADKHLESQAFMRGRYGDKFWSPALLACGIYSAAQIQLQIHSDFNLFLQNSDGIFPNAAIAKKLGEVMGDSSEDISKTPSKK